MKTLVVLVIGYLIIIVVIGVDKIILIQIQWFSNIHNGLMKKMTQYLFFHTNITKKRFKLKLQKEEWTKSALVDALIEELMFLGYTVGFYPNGLDEKLPILNSGKIIPRIKETVNE